jgi:nucleoside-diphosphate-sugar epimerase
MLVTGATGNIGAPLVGLLQAQGTEVRAGVMDLTRTLIVISTGDTSTRFLRRCGNLTPI